MEFSAKCKQCRAKLKTELESKLSIPSLPLVCDIGTIAQQKEDLMQASFVSSSSSPKISLINSHRIVKVKGVVTWQTPLGRLAVVDDLSAIFFRPDK